MKDLQCHGWENVVIRAPHVLQGKEIVKYNIEMTILPWKWAGKWCVPALSFYNKRWHIQEGNITFMVDYCMKVPASLIDGPFAKMKGMKTQLLPLSLTEPSSVIYFCFLSPSTKVMHLKREKCFLTFIF